MFVRSFASKVFRNAAGEQADMLQMEAAARPLVAKESRCLGRPGAPARLAVPCRFSAALHPRAAPLARAA